MKLSPGNQMGATKIGWQELKCPANGYIVASVPIRVATNR